MKNTRNLKINKYQFGNFSNFQPYGEMAGTAGNLIQGFSGGSDAGNIIGGVGQGVASGAMFGPIGMAAGGVLGGITSAIGNSKKRKQERAIKYEMQRQKDVANFNNSLAQSQQLQSEYYQQNGENVSTFYNGGYTSNLSYVNHNESLRTPDGSMYRAKGYNPRAKDDILVNLPENTGILSDSIKVPGSNKTFAEAGHELQKNMYKGNKEVGVIANTTNSINKWAANNKYNDYLSLQESVKQEKGLSNGTKELPSFNKGGVTTTNDYLKNYNIGFNNDMNNIPRVYDNRYVTGNVLNPIKTPDITLNKVQPDPYQKNNNFMGNVSGILGDTVNKIGTLAPTMYNIYRGTQNPEYEAPVMNPYAGSIIRNMSSRRFDPTEMYKRNRTATNIANYNANNITGSGQNMAFRLANAAMERSANADVNFRAQEINNMYKSDLASSMNNLGGQYTRAMELSNDLNARNRAATRDYTAKAMSQINEYSQMNQLMENQKGMDNKKLELYKILGRYGLTEKDLTNIQKLLKN